MTDSRIQWDSHHGPAINVKDYGKYDHDLPYEVAEAAFERIAEGFWRDAEEIGKQYGYEITSAGRMGGWLVPRYSRSYGHYRTLEDYVEDHYYGEGDEDYRDEVAKFERFGAEIVGLFECWRQELQEELTAEQTEADESANLLEQGTPSRGY